MGTWNIGWFKRNIYFRAEAVCSKTKEKIQLKNLVVFATKTGGSGYISICFWSPVLSVFLLYSRLAPGLFARTVNRNRQLGLMFLKQGTEKLHKQCKQGSPPKISHSKLHCTVLIVTVLYKNRLGKRPKKNLNVNFFQEGGGRGFDPKFYI